MRKVNVELLQEILEHIEKNEELWRQKTWGFADQNGYEGDAFQKLIAEDPYNPACNSAYCFAGHVIISEGYVPIFETRAPAPKGQLNAVWSESCTKKGNITKKGGLRLRAKEFDIGLKARELLGISPYSADRLFDGANDLHQIRGYVEQLIEHGEVVSYVQPADESVIGVDIAPPPTADEPEDDIVF